MTANPRLAVHIWGDHKAFEGSPTSVMVEVRGPKCTLIDRRMVEINAPTVTKMRLGEPGPHAVRATLGSGAVLEEYFEFDGDKPPQIRFDVLDQSPHESLQRVATVHPLVEQPPKMLTASPHVSAWVRLWERAEGEWRSMPPPLDFERCEWHEDAVRYRLELGRRQYLLQVGAPSVPTITTALPATGATDVVVQPISLPDSRSRFQLSVVPVSDDAATLLGYIGTGDTRAVEAMTAASELTTNLLSGQSMLDSELPSPNDAVLAEMLLYHKVADPNSAALGGYYLLRIGELERLHSWPANLANWMSWMSDGAIIRGWQLLHGARAHHNETPRQRFLEAVKRGLPVYSDGLRLVIDGLKVLYRKNPGDVELADAIEMMGAYAAAADWSQVVLTFYGNDPMSPGRGCAPTSAAGAKATIMLHSITTDDLVAHRLLFPHTALTVSAKLVDELRERASVWRHSTGFGEAIVSSNGSLVTSQYSFDDPTAALVDAGLWPWDGWNVWSRPDGVSLAKLRDLARRYPPEEAEALARPIAETPIPMRAAKALAASGVTIVADLVAKTARELLSIRGIGPRLAEQTVTILADWGVTIRRSTGDF